MVRENYVCNLFAKRDTSGEPRTSKYWHATSSQIPLELSDLSLAFLVVGAAKDQGRFRVYSTLATPVDLSPCCVTSEFETLEHLLDEGEIAFIDPGDHSWSLRRSQQMMELSGSVE